MEVLQALQSRQHALEQENAQLRAEHAAITAEKERLHHILDDIPVMITRYDPTPRVLFINKEFTRVLGWSNDDIKDKDLMSLIFPDPRYRQSVCEYMQAATNEWREFRLLTQFGHRIDTQWCNLRLPDSTQIGIGLDITAQRRAEQVARDILDKTKIQLWAFDGQLYNYINAECRRFIGLDPTLPLTIERWTELVHPDDLETTTRIWLENWENKTEHDNFFRLRRYDGEYRHFFCHAVPIFDPDGEFVHFQGFNVDITELKQTQAALAQANIRLERSTAAAQRLAAEAQRASQTKSRFLASISHEFRTPMNAVIGMANLLLDTSLTDEQHHYAATIRTSSEALLSLINDLLDLAKIEAGQLRLDPVEFDLVDFLHNLADVVAQPAHAKGLELICDVAPELPARVIGDPNRLRQILMNLLGNAIKFTHTGEIVLRAAPAATESEPHRVRLTVRDTGIGIPADQIDRLFQPFSQLDVGITRQFGGTGLGLAIAKQLTELMQGRIGVDNASPCGSLFYLELPLTIASPADPSREGLPKTMHGTPAIFIEDNTTLRQLIADHLTRWGLRTTVAPTASEGLQAIDRAEQDNDPYRFVILDTTLADINPYTFTQHLLARLPQSERHIILLKALGTPRTHSALPDCANVAYLNKPIKLPELLKLLTKLGTTVTPTVTSTPSTRTNEFNELRTNLALRRARILVADDSATNRRVAFGLLTKLGMTVATVHNGQEAIAALTDTTFDLVLMDLQMPIMDGLQASEIIRDQSSLVLNHDIPVIALTAHAMEEHRDHCLTAGMNDFLAKPIDLRTLANLLKKWLTDVPVGQPNASYPAANSKQPNRDDPTIWDRASLSKRLMHDQELTQAIVAEFLDDLPEQLANLKASIAAGDLVAARQQAHRVKGSVANINAETMRRIAQAIEEAAKRDDHAALANQIAELEASFCVLKTVMHQHDDSK